MITKCHHLEALLFDTKDVHFVWRFDEQQADPIHHQFDFEKAKREYQALVKRHEKFDAKLTELQKLL